jgi:hypothetical protein
MACLALNWPGHFTWDSVVQLGEGRRGVYSGQHPPVMSWLLGLADALRPGAALFVVLDVALIYGGLLALALLGRPGIWLTAPASVLFALTPQLAIYPAIVWKDVLFAGAATAGFAWLAWAGTLWRRPAWRWPLLTAGLLLLTLGTLTRQNSAAVLPFAAAAVGWNAARASASRRMRAGLGYGFAFLAGCAAVMVAASAALDTRVTGAHGVAQQWEHLQVYDLAGAAARDPKLDLAVLHAQAPWLESLIEDDGAPDYSASRIDTIADDVLTPIDARPEAAAPIAAQWWDLILHHPLLYLQVRAAAFRWVLLTPKPAECVMVETGVDGGGDELKLAGLAERQTPRDDAIGAYAGAFIPTPVYSHGLYAVVALGLLALLLRRRRAADIAVAAMVGGALAFAASFALISIACDYRYLYDLDLAAIAATLYAVATRAWRRDLAATV